MGYNITNPSLREARSILGIHVKGRTSWFNRCVGGKLKNTHPGVAGVKDAFTSAAKSCKR